MNTPEQYRQEADRLRQEAAVEKHADLRDGLLEVARQYDTLALGIDRFVGRVVGLENPDPDSSAT